MFCSWHSKGSERATRAIGGVQSSMRATTVIMRYCDQPASRVGIWLVYIYILCYSGNRAIDDTSGSFNHLRSLKNFTLVSKFEEVTTKQN